MKKFLATILTLCVLGCSAFALTACNGDGGIGGDYEQGPNATARPNVTTVADETEWEKLLSLSDSYPCTLTFISASDSTTDTSIYAYNGTVIKETHSNSNLPYNEILFFEKVDDVYYQYSKNELGIYEKELIETSDLGFDPFYLIIDICAEMFAYSDFTYNTNTLRYENGDNYVKFVDGRLSEAYDSYYTDTTKITYTIKVTYGKVDITLPQV